MPDKSTPPILPPAPDFWPQHEHDPQAHDGAKESRKLEALPTPKPPPAIPEEWQGLIDQARKADPSTGTLYASSNSVRLRWRMRDAWARVFAWWPLMWKKNCDCG